MQEDKYIDDFLNNIFEDISNSQKNIIETEALDLDNRHGPIVQLLIEGQVKRKRKMKSKMKRKRKRKFSASVNPRDSLLSI
jgi:hypothetical protein